MHGPCLARPIFLKCENSGAVTIRQLEGVGNHDFRSGLLAFQARYFRTTNSILTFRGSLNYFLSEVQVFRP